ncbi:hypothetical protein [Pseudarthrobacter sp. S9]|uniref:hypothetical protein n=1 Tax=Pseudarthrobacter sp. S9 TaxID=3418421 RepID=UPI003D009378
MGAGDSDGVMPEVGVPDAETDADGDAVAAGPAAGGPGDRRTAAPATAANSTTVAAAATKRRRSPAKIDHMLQRGTTGNSRARAERPGGRPRTGGRPRSAGGGLMSGSLNREAAVRMQVTALMEESHYSRIVALGKEASESHAP